MMRLPGAAAVAVLLGVGGPAAATDWAAALRQWAVAQCGAGAQAGVRWHADRRLDRAAQLWARGASLHEAVRRSDFAASQLSGLHFYGLDGAPPRLRAPNCRMLADRSLRELGAYQRDDELWIVLAAATQLPAARDDAATVQHALRRVNAARQTGRRCGDRDWPRAPPLRLSAALAGVAAGHARDMAARGFFEHLDPEGRTPADRVRAAGYRELRVGENIARGALSVDDAIDGWLASPGHCENIMDPAFTEMGIAPAAAPDAADSVYWVLLLGRPGQARAR